MATKSVYRELIENRTLFTSGKLGYDEFSARNHEIWDRIQASGKKARVLADLRREEKCIAAARVSA